MTLRGRVTAAVLAAVLGPVLLATIFVGAAVNAESRSRTGERLDVAVSGIRAALDALCTRLRTAAEVGALLGAGPDATAAQQVVDARLAAGLRLAGGDGTTRYASPGLPPGPWADCAGSAAEPAAFTAISARVPVPGAQGGPAGYAEAVAIVDTALVERLGNAGAAAVTVLAPGPSPSLSTERARDLPQVLAAAKRAQSSGMVETERGRCVRRLPAGPGQPLPIAVSVGADEPGGLIAVLAGVVSLAGVLAALAAGLLTRSTSRPLTELAQAVDRMASGDLDARVPVRSQDEVGRLGATFNRMARETRGYVRALTASRDQLRGHLGLLGDTLSSTHDLDRILQVILQTALAATGAQAGVLLLAEPGTGNLIGQCGEGLDERGTAGRAMVATEVRVPVGEGLLGAVAATGEARRGRVDRDGPALSRSEPRCRTYVAVPFAASDGGSGGAPGPTSGAAGTGVTDPAVPAARGVLALYDRHGFDEFDDSDLVTLRTFAGQAAVALDNVRVHEEAQRLSLTDPLTGLSNYLFLRESIRREVERAHRFGRALAVLALDLDRFKEVNEEYGHVAGDGVLAEVARRLRVEIREVDLAFRQGGEEFVVLLPETDAAGATVVAERLGAAIRSAPVAVGSAQYAQPVPVPTTVSIGIAVYPDHGSTAPAILEAADDALYAAKTAGRDTYRMAQASTTAVDTTGNGASAQGAAGGAPGQGAAGRAADPGAPGAADGDSGGRAAIRTPAASARPGPQPPHGHGG